MKRTYYHDAKNGVKGIVMKRFGTQLGDKKIEISGTFVKKAQ